MRELDFYIAYLTIPRTADDTDLWRWHSAGRGRSITLRPDNLGTIRATLGFLSDVRGLDELDRAGVVTILRRTFADVGWVAPRVLAALDDAPLYFDAVGQARMPTWSSGRVALVGDAAHCSSPISGMSTSLALTGAYVLAGELAAHPHRTAFARYEASCAPTWTRPRSSRPGAPRIANPRSRAGVAVMNTVLRIAGPVSARRRQPDVQAVGAARGRDRPPDLPGAGGPPARLTVPARVAGPSADTIRGSSGAGGRLRGVWGAVLVAVLVALSCLVGVVVLYSPSTAAPAATPAATPVSAPAAAPAAALRVMTWNVKTNEFDAPDWAPVVAEQAPDVVAFQEICAGDAEDLADLLRTQHGLDYQVVPGSAREAIYETCRSTAAGPVVFGQAVLSRCPCATRSPRPSPIPTASTSPARCCRSPSTCPAPPCAC